MYVGAIDEVQAEKVGNRVVVDGGYQVLIDGVTGEEITKVPIFGTIQPQNVVYGDCGTSYFYLYDSIAYDDVLEFETGFDVNGRAVDIDWWVDIDGPGGFGTSWFDSSALFFATEWDSGLVEEYTGANGWHEGQVRSGSNALLFDGRICFSGMPFDSGYVS